jgi:hypothetical protein
MSNQQRKIVVASGRLTAFIDFLYAIVFGFVLVGMYEELANSKVIFLAKVITTLLLLGVFYFVVNDWIYGVTLIERNPYRGYRRFSYEVFIAFFGYGALLYASKRSLVFLVFLALMLFVTSVWNRRTLREYPESGDARLLGGYGKN